MSDPKPAGRKLTILAPLRHSFLSAVTSVVMSLSNPRMDERESRVEAKPPFVDRPAEPPAEAAKAAAAGIVIPKDLDSLTTSFAIPAEVPPKEAPAPKEPEVVAPAVAAVVATVPAAPKPPAA